MLERIEVGQEITPQLTPEQRRQSFIANVRARLMQNPNTRVSYQLKSPDDTYLSLSYSTAHERRQITCGIDELTADRKSNWNGGNDPIPESWIYIDQERQDYGGWLIDSVRGEEAVRQAELDIDRFLPSEYPNPAT